MQVKSIEITELKNNLLATLKSLGRNDMLVIKSRGKMTGKAIIDEEILEDLLLLRDDIYVSEIAKAREEIKRGDVYTLGASTNVLYLR